MNYLNKAFPAWKFNKVADFGQMKSVYNPNNGSRVTKFVKDFSLHYMIKNRTLNQQYQTLGTTFENTITMIVAHSNKLIENQLVQINGKTYKIINLSFDDSTQAIRYDYLTLALTTKGV